MVKTKTLVGTGARQRLLLLFGLGLAGLWPLYAQNQYPTRIVSKKHTCSVVFPKGWYVFNGGDLPLFFNYRLDDAPDFPNLPSGGAQISLVVPDELQVGRGVSSTSSWVEDEVTTHRGQHVERIRVRGPEASGATPALQVSFEQLALGTPGQSLRFVALVWQSRGKLFAAELSYVEGDPKSKQYQTVLNGIVRSFKPN